MRAPAVSGKFYPDNPTELREMINTYLAGAPDYKVNDTMYGIVVPHAGYVFSGAVAAHAFKAIAGQAPDTVILIGESHNFFLSKAALFAGEGFNTPLGDVKTDKEIISELAKAQDFFEINDNAHSPPPPLFEHCLEVELPFMQTVLKNFKIVPVLVSNNPENAQSEAKAIVSAISKFPGKKVLFVISSDMSHYPDYDTACKIDKESLDALGKFDPEYFKKVNNSILSRKYRNVACEFCGESAVMTGMYAARMLGANKAEVLRYANSGDIPVYGDKTKVVGYGAAAFIKSEHKDEAIKVISKPKTPVIGEAKKMSEFKISEKNQKVLLDLARRTIREYIRSKKAPPYVTGDKELTSPAAVFVTLNEKKQLRGCIGTTVPQLPLYQAVQQMAVAAAFEDHRFGPVADEEMPDIKIEISVLSPLTRVKSADEIKPPQHGVIARRGGRSGLFLPQVWEHFSNKEDFLDELCMQKAGLEANAWKDPSTELYIFTVFAFEEK